MKIIAVFSCFVGFAVGKKIIIGEADVVIKNTLVPSLAVAGSVDRNIIYSPVAFKMLLALMSIGSRGNSGKQIIRAFKLPMNGNVTVKAYAALIKLIDSHKNAIVEGENHVIYDKSVTLHPHFLEKLPSFAATAEKANLEKPETVKKIINAWFKKRTHGLLNSAPGQVPQKPWVIILNALYFKGNFESPFDESHTKPIEFKDQSGTVCKVLTMEKKGPLLYGDSNKLKATLVGLPYTKNTHMLVIILPHQGTTVKQVIKTIQSNEGVIPDMKKRQVHLQLPKFKITTDLDLRKPLKELGVTNIFINGTADLGILLKRKAFVSYIGHRSYIEVNEKGTLAAAGSIAQIPGSPPPRPAKVFVNRPFLFGIVQNYKIKIPLFAGVVIKLCKQ